MKKQYNAATKCCKFRANNGSIRSSTYVTVITGTSAKEISPIKMNEVTNSKILEIPLSAIRLNLNGLNNYKLTIYMNIKDKSDKIKVLKTFICYINGNNVELYRQENRTMSRYGIYIVVYNRCSDILIMIRIL